MNMLDIFLIGLVAGMVIAIGLMVTIIVALVRTLMNGRQ
jgi:hypothetical protein